MNWKIIGALATIASAGLTLVCDKVSEEKMKEQIREEVKAQLSKENEEKEEESC